jgi:hypothetical protein
MAMPFKMESCHAVYGGHGRPPLHIKLKYLEHLKYMAIFWPCHLKWSHAMQFMVAMAVLHYTSNSNILNTWKCMAMPFKMESFQSINKLKETNLKLNLYYLINELIFHSLLLDIFTLI